MGALPEGPDAATGLCLAGRPEVISEGPAKGREEHIHSFIHHSVSA